MATAFRNLMAYAAGLFTSARLFLATTLMPEITELQEDNARLARRNRILRQERDALRPWTGEAYARRAREILARPRLAPFHEQAALVLAMADRHVTHSTDCTHPADRWGVPGIFFPNHPAWKSL